MTSSIGTSPESRLKRWTGRTLSGLVVLFLAMDAAIKIIFLRDVPEASAHLGWPAHLAAPLGYTLLACTLLYAWPRTAVLGVILLTGYLGGAVATHVRIGSPLFTHVLFGVYVGAAAWGGLYLRDKRLREILLGTASQGPISLDNAWPEADPTSVKQT